MEFDRVEKVLISFSCTADQEISFQRSLAALDRPRCGPSRPRDAGKLQDRLRTWHGRTGKGTAASYFAVSGAANYELAAVLTSPMGQKLKFPNSVRTGTSCCHGSPRKWRRAQNKFCDAASA